jgi:alkylhydroperoxidase family enzyme
MSLRLAGARSAGVDETTLEQVDRFERSDLPDPHKTALRLADAFVANPAGIGDRLRSQVHAHFRPEQVVELTLDVIAWSKQKIPVALGLDAPLDPERPTVFDFDEDGHPAIGGERFVAAFGPGRASGPGRAERL